MMMIQLGVDVVEELKLLLPSYYDLIVPSTFMIFAAFAYLPAENSKFCVAALIR